MELVFLGTGGSMGVPVIGCSCATCLSDHPKNRRLRPAALLEVKGKNILIDPGQDLREQVLREKIPKLDGVIVTHSHQDHIGGIDDLRAFYMLSGKTLDMLVYKESYLDLETRYPYIFAPKKKGMSVIPRFSLQVVDQTSGTLEFCGETIGYFTYKQHGMTVLGLRLDRFAYVTDIKEYDDEVYAHLEGVETLVLSALREEPSPLHFTVEEAIGFGQRVGAKRVFLTHIAHELEHVAAAKTLPEGFFLAYDGLRISI